jgi:hypothetical protein
MPRIESPSPSTPLHAARSAARGLVEAVPRNWLVGAAVVAYFPALLAGVVAAPFVVPAATDLSAFRAVRYAILAAGAGYVLGLVALFR